jgi:hypothetical protein
LKDASRHQARSGFGSIPTRGGSFAALTEEGEMPELIKIQAKGVTYHINPEQICSVQEASKEKAELVMSGGDPLTLINDEIEAFWKAIKSN